MFRRARHPVFRPGVRHGLGQWRARQRGLAAFAPHPERTGAAHGDAFGLPREPKRRGGSLFRAAPRHVARKSLSSTHQKKPRGRTGPRAIAQEASGRAPLLCTHPQCDRPGIQRSDELWRQRVATVGEQQKSGGLAGTRRPIGATDGTQMVAIHGGRESLRTGVETKGARSSQSVPA